MTTPKKLGLVTLDTRITQWGLNEPRHSSIPFPGGQHNLHEAFATLAADRDGTLTLVGWNHGHAQLFNVSKDDEGKWRIMLTISVPEKEVELPKLDGVRARLRKAWQILWKG